jgi:hypothetical protein
MICSLEFPRRARLLSSEEERISLAWQLLRKCSFSAASIRGIWLLLYMILSVGTHALRFAFGRKSATEERGDLRRELVYKSPTMLLKLVSISAYLAPSLQL